MVKHIVAWTFPEKNKAKELARIKSLLDALPALIPEIQQFEVGVNFNESQYASDLVLISGFASREAMSIYAQHPDHQRVVAEINKVVTDRVVVDFED